MKITTYDQYVAYAVAAKRDGRLTDILKSATKESIIVTTAPIPTRPNRRLTLGIYRTGSGGWVGYVICWRATAKKPGAEAVEASTRGSDFATMYERLTQKAIAMRHGK